MELMCIDTGRRRSVRIGETILLNQSVEWGFQNEAKQSHQCTFVRRNATTAEVRNDKASIFIRRKNKKNVIEVKAGNVIQMQIDDVVSLERKLHQGAGFVLRAIEPSSRMFRGERFVFLTKSHIGQLRQKLIDHGGEVLEKINEDTHFAIVSNSDDESGELQTIHPRTKIVRRGFISDSIALGKRQDMTKYLVVPPKTHPIKAQPHHFGSLPVKVDSNHFGDLPFEEEPCHFGNLVRLDQKEIEIPEQGVQSQSLQIRWPQGYEWMEDYDFEQAKATVERLYRHWTHSKSSFPLDLEVNKKESRSEVEYHQTRTGSECICGHPCCSKQCICFVEQLQRVKDHYHGGRVDQYKIKVINKAIRVLETLTYPLTSEIRIESLLLGNKTTEKLKQIFNTGCIQRNLELSGDEFENVFKIFTNVWGAGEATARKWIAAKCKSLEDVAHLPNLTEMQRVGISYHDDFQKKIPRNEATQIFQQVRRTTLFVIARMLDTTLCRCQSTVFCSALGSYIRGKDEVGDIDILISPPKDSGLVPHEVLDMLLKELLKEGLITTDFQPGRSKFRKEAMSSWMGVCFSPDKRFRRRIDIKVYEAASLPFALNYFIGSQDFVRALRFWCITPPKEVLKRAHRFCQGADAFHLSDLGLFPTYRSNTRSETKSIESIASPIRCEMESDIFKAVGLAYVPPWMRHFSNQ